MPKPCSTSYRADAFGKNVHCSKCGVDNRQAARFCDGCGFALQPQCISCGAVNRLGAKFCDGCGAVLTGSASPAAATNRNDVRFSVDVDAVDVTEGERKTVTALFADIKGSMELVKDLDPDRLLADGTDGAASIASP
jgi:hypothetical protein